MLQVVVPKVLQWAVVKDLEVHLVHLIEICDIPDMNPVPEKVIVCRVGILHIASGVSVYSAKSGK